MKKLILLLFLSGTLYAQSSSELERRAGIFYSKFQPEYMFIHLNNDLYFSGETLWYSAYLYNIPYSANNLSSIAYVELLKDGKLLSRHKLKLTAGAASGDFSLPPNLNTGLYQIRGFSSWMKNLGESCFYERTIKVVNPENPYAELMIPEQPDDNIISIQTEKEFVVISVKPTQGDKIAVLNNGKMVSSKPLDTQGTELRIAKIDLANNILLAGIFDKEKLLYEKALFYQESGAAISTNKENYSARDRIDVAISSATQEKSSGNYSITVRPKNMVGKATIERVPGWSDVLKFYDETPTQSKEMIIYPKSSKNLEPVSFAPVRDTAQGNKAITVDPVVQQALTRNKLAKSIADSYGIESPQLENTSHQLPYDVVYYPKDFVTLPTMEDFFVEIIPQVRVKKIKGIKTIRIRNSENSQRIYFYKSAPMMIMDGAVITDASDILVLDPQEVKSVNVAFKLNTINSSGIAGLADHGILTIFTKKKANLIEESVIFKGFHIPSTFAAPSYQRSAVKKDVVPDLRNPIFWRSRVKINDRTGNSFYLSDELGEFVIEVKGIGQNGAVLLSEETILVSAPQD